MTSQPQPSSTYVLGHSKEELDRLVAEGRFLGELSDHLLRLAGVAAGMQVLDVGCGAGDLSFLTADIVGPEGRVVGVDQSPESIATAIDRARARGQENVTFIAGDAKDVAVKQTFDAVIGRLVLMYFADPAVLVRRLAACVKPGGIVTFQEFDMDGCKSAPRCEVFEAAVERLRVTFRRVGADPRMGLKLGRVFEDAGLPPPQMRLSARVERGPDSQAYHQVTDITRTLLPAMEMTGVATAAEVRVDTLAARMRDEAVAVNATLVSPSLIGAWSSTPVA